MNNLFRYSFILHKCNAIHYFLPNWIIFFPYSSLKVRRRVIGVLSGLGVHENVYLSVKTWLMVLVQSEIRKSILEDQVFLILSIELRSGNQD